PRHQLLPSWSIRLIASLSPKREQCMKAHVRLDCSCTSCAPVRPAKSSWPSERWPNSTSAHFLSTATCFFLASANRSSHWQLDTHCRQFMDGANTQLLAACWVTRRVFHMGTV